MKSLIQNSLFVLLLFCCQKPFAGTLNDSLKTRIVSIETELKEMKTLYDKKVIKEEYFNTILGSQTQIFSLIVAIIIGLFSLITFAKIKSEIDRVEKKINGIDETIDKNMKETEVITNVIYKRLHRLGANTGIMISEYYLEKGRHYFAFKFAMLTARYLKGAIQYTENEIDKKEMADALYMQLDNAISILESNKQEIELADIFKSNNKKSIEDLNVLSKSDDQEIMNRTAKIRTLINEYLQIQKEERHV